MAIIVFGSANVDISVDVEALPRSGETVHCSDCRIGLGGKGVNQAVAASRLSESSVMFVGAIGTDHFGSIVEGELERLGISTTGIRLDPVNPTGVALIHVDKMGSNSITVSGGANLCWTKSDISELSFDGISVGLCQLETPLAETFEVLKQMSAAGGITILDPTPVPLSGIDEIYTAVDVLTPNQQEAERLLNRKIENPTDAVKGAVTLCNQGGLRAAIITMGESGIAFSEDAKTGVWLPAFEVNAVDTVAAGDCFNGALAAFLSAGATMRESISFAMAASALSVTTTGAADSMPSLSTVKKFLENR